MERMSTGGSMDQQRSRDQPTHAHSAGAGGSSNTVSGTKQPLLHHQQSLQQPQQSSRDANVGSVQQQQQATIIELRKQLREQFETIEALKRQNSRLSVLVDTAVVKLESLGYSLIPPFDIERELLAARTEASSMRNNALNEQQDGKREDGKDPVTHGGMATTTSGGKSSNSTRKFRMQHELKEHRGAVTCGQFSPDGQSFCAGSYDGRCSVWRVRSERIRQPSAMLCGSEAMISDLSWYPTSDRVVTTGFDGCARSYAVETGNQIHNFEPLDGALMLATTTTPHQSLFICSDSRQGMHLVDVRVKNGAVESWRSESGNLSALAVDGFSNQTNGRNSREWIRVLSGDTSGELALWDLRMVASAAQQLGNTNDGNSAMAQRTPTRRTAEEFPANPEGSETSTRYTREATSRWHDARATAEGSSSAVDPSSSSSTTSSSVVRFPISHISLHQHSGDDSERLLVVSEEGTLRLYHRQANYGSDPLKEKAQQQQAQGGSSSSGVQPPLMGTRAGDRTFTMRTLATGVPTRSNPIRAGYRPGNTQARRLGIDDDFDGIGQSGVRAISDSDLLVVGGTDHNIAVFDVSGDNRHGDNQTKEDGGAAGPQGESKRGRGRDDGDQSCQRQEAQLIQLLEGHKDTVYGAVFHPDEPIIASFSADSTIRIWVPQQKKF